MRNKSIAFIIILLVMAMGLTGCRRDDRDDLKYKAEQNVKQAVLCLYDFESLTDIKNNLEKLETITSPDFYAKHSDLDSYRKYEGYTQRVDVKYAVAECVSGGTRGLVVAKFITHNILLDEIDVSIKSFYFETDSKGLVTMLSEVID